MLNTCSCFVSLSRFTIAYRDATHTHVSTGMTFFLRTMVPLSLTSHGKKTMSSWNTRPA